MAYSSEELRVSSTLGARHDGGDIRIDLQRQQSRSFGLAWFIVGALGRLGWLGRCSGSSKWLFPSSTLWKLRRRVSRQVKWWTTKTAAPHVQQGSRRRVARLAVSGMVQRPNGKGSRMAAGCDRCVVEGCTSRVTCASSRGAGWSIARRTAGSGVGGGSKEGGFGGRSYRRVSMSTSEFVRRGEWLV